MKNQKGAFGRKKPDVPYTGKVIPKKDRIIGYNCNSLGAQIPIQQPVNFWGKRAAQH